MAVVFQDCIQVVFVFQDFLIMNAVRSSSREQLLKIKVGNYLLQLFLR